MPRRVSRKDDVAVNPKDPAAPGSLRAMRRVHDHNTGTTEGALSSEIGGRQADGTISAAPENRDPADPEHIDRK